MGPHIGIQVEKLGLQLLLLLLGCEVAQVEHVAGGNVCWAGRERERLPSFPSIALRLKLA